MKISVYTTVQNAIENEYTLFEGCKEALKFCDEFVFVDGGSIDGTLELMQYKARKEPRIKIIENPWPVNMHKSATVIQKNLALSHCTGDWCFLMDADEVYSGLEKMVAIESCLITLPQNITSVICKTVHFYGDFQHICLKDPLMGHSYYTGKIYGIRNNLGIHHGNAAGDHDGFVDNDDKSLDHPNTSISPITVFHYGHVRSNELYLKKKNGIEARYHLDWQNLTEWNFEKIIIEHSNCFTIFSGGHSQSMVDRSKLSSLTKENLVQYYREWLSKNWL